MKCPKSGEKVENWGRLGQGLRSSDKNRASGSTSAVFADEVCPPWRKAGSASVSIWLCFSATCLFDNHHTSVHRHHQQGVVDNIISEHGIWTSVTDLLNTVLHTPSIPHRLVNNRPFQSFGTVAQKCNASVPVPVIWARSVHCIDVTLK